jgi:small multidrug resistance family-3 protein
MYRTVRFWVSDSDILRSTTLFVLAGLLEIGGAYLLWRAVRAGGGVWLAALGGLLLVLYGAVVTLQPDIHFGRILAAYGGVFIAGSLAWGAIFDRFQPDRYDISGATICLVGVGLIMYAPRGGG